MKQENKNNARKAIWIIMSLVVIIILMNTLVMTGFFVRNTNEELTIGVILPLSGDFAVIGSELQKGIKLAKDESKVNVRIIYEDDQFDPKMSLNAANKLLNFGNIIDIGITPFVEGAKPTIPLFENKKTPLITAWDSTHLVDENDFLFSTGFSTEKAGEKMADFAFNELELRKIAVVSHNDAWSELISDSFKEKFIDLGGKIVMHEKHDINEVDYRSTILKMKSLDIDGVYMPLIHPTNVNFLKQVKELDLDTTLLEGDALFLESIEDAGESAEGIFFTNIFTDNSVELAKKYKEKFGEDPLDITIVSFGFDAFNAAVEAHEKNPDDLNEGLFDVIGGKTLDRIEKIFRVEGGEVVEVE